MSDLIVVAYDTEDKAEEVRAKLLKMTREYLVDIEDAVVAVKNQDGKVKLRQMYNLTATGALSGGFWGLLVGTIFLSPLLGLAIGAGAGAVTGALSDMGIDDRFMTQPAESFTPGFSLLFCLVRKATPDKVLAELAGTAGKGLQTSPTPEVDPLPPAAPDPTQS